MEKSKVFDFRVYPYYTGNNDVSCDGSPYEDDWQLDENGIPYIAGQINVDEMIQQYEKECDINHIIAQHMALGSLAELGISKDSISDKIIDVSNMPEDLNSMNEARVKAEKMYNCLTSEQKALFTGFEDFVSNFDKLFVKKDDNSEVENNES